MINKDFWNDIVGNRVLATVESDGVTFMIDIESADIKDDVIYNDKSELCLDLSKATRINKTTDMHTWGETSYDLKMPNGVNVSLDILVK